MGWSAEMRVIARAERPYPGTRLRFTDSNGNRLHRVPTKTRGCSFPELEMRHRRRARCVDWFRKANDGGLNHPPLQDFSHNQIGIAVVMLPPNRLLGHRRWTSLERDARILEPNH
jgi:hypothetical protein